MPIFPASRDTTVDADAGCVLVVYPPGATRVALPATAKSAILAASVESIHTAAAGHPLHEDLAELQEEDDLDQDDRKMETYTDRVMDLDAKQDKVARARTLGRLVAPLSHARAAATESLAGLRVMPATLSIANCVNTDGARANTSLDGPEKDGVGDSSAAAAADQAGVPGAPWSVEIGEDDATYDEDSHAAAEGAPPGCHWVPHGQGRPIKPLRDAYVT